MKSSAYSAPLRLLGVGLWLLLAGCGYRLAGKTSNIPGEIHTLSIPTLANRTTLPQVEQLFTRALIEQASESTKYRIVSEKGGEDARLEGEIISFSAAPVAFSAESFASTFLVTIQISLRITQQPGNKVLLENPGYLFRDQYVINIDVKQFFSEQNPALRRIAKDFAASVVATFLNSF